MLAACQPQNPAAARAIPTNPPGDLLYIQDPGGPRMLQLNWSGKVVGWVSAQGFAGPSPNGSRFLHAGDPVVVEDWRGHLIGQLDVDPNAYGLLAWAEDNIHLCGIVFPTNAGPDSGQGRLWIGAPGEKGRTFGPVGQAGSDPAVTACSIKNNRVVVAGGLMPHWPPGGTRYLITTDIEVVNLTTGAVEYQHQYPVGNLGGQMDVGPRGDWILAATSPDGRYVAESGVFNGTTIVRDLPTGKQMATLPGQVAGFSSDGTRIVTTVESGGSAEARLVSWADYRAVWRASGVAQSTLARPNSPDVLIGMSTAGGSGDELVVVRGDGTSSVIVWNGSVVKP
jgi:WD40 repeat protein